MGVLFVVLGVLGYLVTGLVSMSATNIVQDILATTGAITSTLFLVGGVLVSELRVISKKLDPKA